MQEVISRKDFLRGASRFFRDEVSGEGGSAYPEVGGYIYPPGIDSEDNYLNRCEQSYNCISKCPHESLFVFRENENDKRFGYPVIDPRRSACNLCENFPCIAACESGALQTEFKNRKLGLAIIDQKSCFAYNGTFCQACIFNCPLSGEAILADDQSRPVVNQELCTGCGICTQSCPMEKAAIVIKANLE